jgi:MFS family permease
VTVCDRELHQQLRRFYGFRFLATSYLYMPIFMLFLSSRGLVFFEQLTLGALYSLVVMMSDVPTGVFADRFGRRSAMIAGSLLMMMSCGVAMVSHHVAVFAIAEIFAALSMSMCSGADSAYLHDLLRSHGQLPSYPRRESIASAWHLAGSALAFLVGGVAAQYDLSLPYALTAVTSASACGCALLLSRTAQPAQRHWQSWIDDCVAAVRVTHRNAQLRWLIGYSAVVFMLLRAAVYIYQPYLVQRGASVVELGFISAGMFAVASFAALLTPRFRARYSSEVMMWTVVMVLISSFALLTYAHAFAFIAALLLAHSVVNGMYSSLTKPLINEQIVDPTQRAAVLSVESMVRRGGVSLLAIITGGLGQSVSLWVAAAAGTVGALLLWSTGRRSESALGSHAQLSR